MFFFLYRNVYLMLNPSYVMPSVSKHVYLMLNPSYVMPSVSETCVFSAEFILCYAFCIKTCKLGFFFSCHILGLIHSCLIHSIVQKVVLNTITLNHQDLFTPYLVWVELNSKLVLCFKYEKLNKSLNTEANLKWSEIEY
jgi:hypothetical protein